MSEVSLFGVDESFLGSLLERLLESPCSRVELVERTRQRLQTVASLVARAMDLEYCVGVEGEIELTELGNTFVEVGAPRFELGTSSVSGRRHNH